MQIAQRLAGYSLGGADLLRRAMGKKKPEEMQKQQANFVAGAVSRGVPAEKAESIFRELEGFASYGFNKSHSAAYALVTYQTAWLKAHYPTEFFAAAMTTDKDKVDKVVRLVAEARAWGVTVLPPDVNASETDFTVVYAYPNGGAPRMTSGKVRDALGPQASLRARRRARRRRNGARNHVRSAARERPVPRSLRFCVARRRQAPEQGRARSARAVRRVRHAARADRRDACARVRGRRSRARAFAKRDAAIAKAGRRACSARSRRRAARTGRRPCRSATTRKRPSGTAWSSCAARRRRSAATSPGIRSFATRANSRAWGSRRARASLRNLPGASSAWRA